MPTELWKASRLETQQKKQNKPKQNQTALYTSLSWHLAPSVIPFAKVSDSDRVVFGAKTLSFCSLTFDRVSIPPDWFLLLHHLCLHLHLFPLSFLSSLFVEALTRMRREPLKMSADAPRCLSSALGIDLCGQFVAPGAKNTNEIICSKFWGAEPNKVYPDCELRRSPLPREQVAQDNRHTMHC